MAQPRSNSNRVLPAARTGNVSYWRVEGSLLELGAMRPVGFFTWNFCFVASAAIAWIFWVKNTFTTS